MGDGRSVSRDGAARAALRYFRRDGGRTAARKKNARRGKRRTHVRDSRRGKPCTHVGGSPCGKSRRGGHGRGRELRSFAVARHARGADRSGGVRRCVRACLSHYRVSFGRGGVAGGRRARVGVSAPHGVGVCGELRGRHLHDAENSRRGGNGAQKTACAPALDVRCGNPRSHAGCVLFRVFPTVRNAGVLPQFRAHRGYDRGVRVRHRGVLSDRLGRFRIAFVDAERVMDGRAAPRFSRGGALLYVLFAACNSAAPARFAAMRAGEPPLAQSVHSVDIRFHRGNKLLAARGAFKYARLAVDDAGKRDPAYGDERGDRNEDDPQPQRDFRKPRDENERDAREHGDRVDPQTDGAELFRLLTLPHEPHHIFLRAAAVLRAVERFSRQQFVHADSELFAQREHQPDFGQSASRLPFGDRLVGDPEPFCKFALRQIARFARSLNERSDFDLIHSVTS